MRARRSRHYVFLFLSFFYNSGDDMGTAGTGMGIKRDIGPNGKGLLRSTL